MKKPVTRENAPVAADLMEKVASARFPRQASIGRALARAAAAGTMSVAEIEHASAAAALRRSELSGTKIDAEPPTDPMPYGEVVEDATTQDGEPWSPSAILRTIPKTPHRLTHIDHTVPNGDRN